LLVKVLHVDVLTICAALLREPLHEAGIWLEFPAVEVQIATKETGLVYSIESVVACSLAVAFCGAALAQLPTAEVVFGFGALGWTGGFAIAVLIAKRSPVIIQIYLLFVSVDFEACIALFTYLCHGRVWMVLVTPQLPLAGFSVI
jgi:hypothetical protein